MILRYLNLYPVIHGVDGLSPDLHELDSHVARLEITDKIRE